MKGNTFKKIVAGISTLAMIGTIGIVPVTVSAETYADQTVDLSKFDASGTYNSDTGVETLNFTGNNRKQWSKLDLTPYTQKGDQYVSSVTISYKDTVSSAGRISIGFYDNDLAQYSTANGWQDTEGVALLYGQTGDKRYRVYYKDNGEEKYIDNATFLRDAQEEVTLTFDLLNMTVNGSIGNQVINNLPISYVNSIDTLGIYSWSATTYEISDMKVTTVTSEDSYYSVTFDVDGVTTVQTIKDGDKVTEVPDTSKDGYNFTGWAKDNDTSKLYTTEEVKNMPITAATTFTAQYEVNSSYIQKIASIEFIDPKTDAFLQPETTDSYTYEIKVTSDIGNDITDDCQIEWTVVGNESDDGYTSLTPDSSERNKAVFSVRNGVSTYYGYIKADVVYDPSNSDNEEDNTTGSAQTPYAVLGSTATSNIIPEGGYPVDMSDYPDSLVGYQATSTGQTTKDLVLNNWSIYGSNGARSLQLVKYDDGTKALKFDKVGGSGSAGASTVGVYQWPAPSGQYIIDAVVRFAEGGKMGVWNNTPNNSGAQSQCEVSITGGQLSAGGETRDGFSSDEFYRIIMSADPETGEYYVKAYDPKTNQLLGEIADVSGAAGNMRYLCMSDAFPIELKSLRVYAPVIEKMTVNTANDVVSVPDEGSTDITLAASALDSDGNRIFGDIAWSLDGEPENVELIPNGQSATLRISAGAAGIVTVNAAKDGVTVQKTITLSTSKEAVSIYGDGSITIPFDGEDAVTAQYSAATYAEGEEIKDVTHTFSFLSRDGATPLETLPEGISFDSQTNILTVTSDARATIMYIRATNSNGISTTKRINIHGMEFVFGSNEPEEGYTQITADTMYTDSMGYGFASADGLTSSADSVSGTNAYKVQIKVPSGNYRVNITTTSESMLSEAVSGSATGVTKTGDQFDVAVCDGVLDLTLNAGSSISSLSIEQLRKDALAMPRLFSIGDSTTNNSGHPSGYDPETSTDHRTYGSWGNCVTEEMYEGVFSSYINYGWAGKNSASYYNLGRLETVLLAIAPGDYVTVNMGINSETGEPYEELMEYYYIQGIIQRGAHPIILTHTPQNPVGRYIGNYDAETGTFNCAREGDGRIAFLKSMAEKYDLPLIDMATWGNDFFNSLNDMPLDDVLAMADTTNKDEDNYVAPSTVYDVVASWSPDWNHYTAKLGTIYAEYIMGEIKEIVVNSDQPTGNITAENFTLANGAATASVVNNTDAAVKVTMYVATYDADDVLTSIQLQTKEIAPDQTEAFSVTNSTAAETTKAFIWNDANNVPIADAQ